MSLVSQGTCVVQSVKCQTLGSVHVMISLFMGLSPALGFKLTVQSLVGIPFYPLSAPPPTHGLSLAFSK